MIADRYRLVKTVTIRNHRRPLSHEPAVTQAAGPGALGRESQFTLGKIGGEPGIA
jgi:hypothetical protein